jgi:membrane associated rhomboid family serine protease
MGAAIAHLIVYWGSPGPVIGASGGVAGLMAAGMRILYGERQRFREDGLAPILARPMVLFTVVWVAMNILVGVTGFSD